MYFAVCINVVTRSPHDNCGRFASATVYVFDVCDLEQLDSGFIDILWGHNNAAHSHISAVNRYELCRRSMALKNLDGQ